jgi:hypothetical protein
MRRLRSFLKDFWPFVALAIIAALAIMVLPGVRH